MLGFRVVVRVKVAGLLVKIWAVLQCDTIRQQLAAATPRDWRVLVASLVISIFKER